jgi:hypothetical protein
MLALVWFDDHPDPKKRLPKPVSKSDEWHGYRTPVSNKLSNQLKPWLETGSVNESVVPAPLAPTPPAALRAAHETLHRYMRRKCITPVGTTKTPTMSAVMELASPLRNGSKLMLILALTQRGSPELS